MEDILYFKPQIKFKEVASLHLPRYLEIFQAEKPIDCEAWFRNPLSDSILLIVCFEHVLFGHIYLGSNQ